MLDLHPKTSEKYEKAVDDYHYLLYNSSLKPLPKTLMLHSS